MDHSVESSFTYDPTLFDNGPSRSGHGKIYVTCGRNMRPLMQSILQQMKCEDYFVNMNVKQFADGEICMDYQTSIRGGDLYIIKSICGPDVNSALMEALLSIDAAHRSQANRVTLVCPYYGYARQDRVAYPRQPLSAKVVADCLCQVGVDHIIVCDIHVPQIQGFFGSKIAFDHIKGNLIFLKRMMQLHNEVHVIISSTDAGGANRCRELAGLLKTDLVVLDKRRYADNQAEVMNVIGNVVDKNVVLYDDICDTAGSLCHAGEALLEQGAKSIYAAITHAVMSGPAVERLCKSRFTKIFFSDSIPMSDETKDKLGERLEIVSCADAIARVMTCAHCDSSVQVKWKEMIDEASVNKEMQEPM